MITIGIDPHKSSLTAVAVNSTGESVATVRMAVTATTVRHLLAWAARWSQRRWAVEGAEGLGRGVAQGLAGAGEQVVDVPAQLAARAREHRRHRLSRAGNRQLNRALHLVAVGQIRTRSQGRDYYQQKLAEMKTPAEARRAVKRRLTDAVYRRITKDQQDLPADT